MQESFVLYISTDRYNEAAVATESKEFAEKLKAWAEEQGYRVKFSKGYKDDGPLHQ